MKNENLEEKIKRATHKFARALLKKKRTEISTLDATKEYTEIALQYDQQKYDNFRVSIKNMESDIKKGLELASKIADRKIFLEKYERTRKALENQMGDLVKDIQRAEVTPQKNSNYNRNELINYRKNFFPKPGDNYGKM